MITKKGTVRADHQLIFRVGPRSRKWSGTAVGSSHKGASGMRTITRSARIFLTMG